MDKNQVLQQIKELKNEQRPNSITAQRMGGILENITQEAVFGEIIVTKSLGEWLSDTKPIPKGVIAIAEGTGITACGDGLGIFKDLINRFRLLVTGFWEGNSEADVIEYAFRGNLQAYKVFKDLHSSYGGGGAVNSIFSLRLDEGSAQNATVIGGIYTNGTTSYINYQDPETLDWINIDVNFDLLGAEDSREWIKRRTYTYPPLEGGKLNNRYMQAPVVFKRLNEWMTDTKPVPKGTIAAVQGKSTMVVGDGIRKYWELIPYVSIIHDGVPVKDMLFTLDYVSDSWRVIGFSFRSYSNKNLSDVILNDYDSALIMGTSSSLATDVEWSAAFCDERLGYSSFAHCNVVACFESTFDGSASIRLSNWFVSSSYRAELPSWCNPDIVFYLNSTGDDCLTFDIVMLNRDIEAAMQICFDLNYYMK